LTMAGAVALGKLLSGHWRWGQGGNGGRSGRSSRGHTAGPETDSDTDTAAASGADQSKESAGAGVGGLSALSVPSAPLQQLHLPFNSLGSAGVSVLIEAVVAGIDPKPNPPKGRGGGGKGKRVGLRSLGLRGNGAGDGACAPLALLLGHPRCTLQSLVLLACTCCTTTPL
jgi:hypothetical protein